MLNILALTTTKHTTTTTETTGNTREKTQRNGGLGMLSKPDSNLKPIHPLSFESRNTTRDIFLNRDN